MVDQTAVKPRRLERHRSYGKVAGDGAGYAFEQDGLYFGGDSLETEIPGGPKMGVEVTNKGGPLTARTDPEKNILVLPGVADVPYTAGRLMEASPEDVTLGVAGMEFQQLRESVGELREMIEALTFENQALKRREIESGKDSGETEASGEITAASIDGMSWTNLQKECAQAGLPITNKASAIQALKELHGLAA